MLCNASTTKSQGERKRLLTNIGASWPHTGFARAVGCTLGGRWFHRSAPNVLNWLYNKSRCACNVKVDVKKKIHVKEKNITFRTKKNETKETFKTVHTIANAFLLLAVFSSIFFAYLTVNAPLKRAKVAGVDTDVELVELDMETSMLAGG